jgi:octaprenyl-diphosphate synthase
MSQPAASFPARLLGDLGSACRGPAPDLARRLHELQLWVAEDLAWVKSELAAESNGTSIVDHGARHVLGLGGKYLRPTCVVLAARLGRGFGPRARDLAVAAELIHNATLLHDDVIDLGDSRRGAPTARIVYGNTASILAGDGLFVAALKRIRRAGSPALLDRALATIEEMIRAEAIQLTNRGRIRPSREDYFRVVEGKTASLFRWALFSGATVGGLPEPSCRALEGFGGHLGVSFQLVDDLLDLTGAAGTTGKGSFNDLTQGRMTYPILLALEREPSLAPTLEAIVGGTNGRAASDGHVARVLEVVASSGAFRDCLALARARSRDAVACLSILPDGAARQALVTTAKAMVCRRR